MFFEPKLKALQTMADALQLVADAPREDAPGRRYYSNLGFFIGNFIPPKGANYTELSLYQQFIERLDAAGGLLNLGDAQVIDKALREAIAFRVQRGF